MKLSNLLGRNRAETAGAPTPDGEPSPSPDLSANDAVQRKQRLLLGGIGVVALAGGCWYIFGTGVTPKEIAQRQKEGEVRVSTTDLVNRNMSEQEWMARSENRFDSTDNQLKALPGQQAQIEQLRKQIEALQGQNQAMAVDGQKVLQAYQNENEALKREVASAKAAPPPAAGPAALYGPGSQPLYKQANTTPVGGAEASAIASTMRAVKTVSFQSGPSGGMGKSAEGGNLIFSDSPNYLPANSIATARVIVGVDASAGVQSQTDPLPVVLRITGPARSAADPSGRALSTRIQGCLVNGAARGDLSSEKVYVKLQRLTCAGPGGKHSVSEVKGFIAFAGKAGVRGRVVSREGALVGQALLAGIAGGFGRGFAANANLAFTPFAGVAGGGQRQKLSTTDILEGGLGQGVAEAGDMVSKYLIERAEQYQPVIEMPTGIDVEIVFLDGAFVRN